MRKKRVKEMRTLELIEQPQLLDEYFSSRLNEIDLYADKFEYSSSLNSIFENLFKDELIINETMIEERNRILAKIENWSHFEKLKKIILERLCENTVPTDEQKEQELQKLLNLPIEVGFDRFHLTAKSEELSYLDKIKQNYITKMTLKDKNELKKLYKNMLLPNTPLSVLTKTGNEKIKWDKNRILQTPTEEYLKKNGKMEGYFRFSIQNGKPCRMETNFRSKFIQYVTEVLERDNKPLTNDEKIEIMTLVDRDVVLKHKTSTDFFEIQKIMKEDFFHFLRVLQPSYESIDLTKFDFIKEDPVSGQKDMENKAPTKHEIETIKSLNKIIFKEDQPEEFDIDSSEESLMRILFDNDVVPETQKIQMHSILKGQKVKFLENLKNELQAIYETKFTDLFGNKELKMNMGDKESKFGKFFQKSHAREAKNEFACFILPHLMFNWSKFSIQKLEELFNKVALIHQDFQRTDVNFAAKYMNEEIIETIGEIEENPKQENKDDKIEKTEMIQKQEHPSKIQKSDSSDILGMDGNGDVLEDKNHQQKDVPLDQLQTVNEEDLTLEELDKLRKNPHYIAKKRDTQRPHKVEHEQMMNMMTAKERKKAFQQYLSFELNKLGFDVNSKASFDQTIKFLDEILNFMIEINFQYKLKLNFKEDLVYVLSEEVSNLFRIKMRILTPHVDKNTIDGITQASSEREIDQWLKKVSADYNETKKMNEENKEDNVMEYNEKLDKDLQDYDKKKEELDDDENITKQIDDYEDEKEEDSDADEDDKTQNEENINQLNLKLAEELERKDENKSDVSAKMKHNENENESNDEEDELDLIKAAQKTITEKIKELDKEQEIEEDDGSNCDSDNDEYEKAVAKFDHEFFEKSGVEFVDPRTEDPFLLDDEIEDNLEEKIKLTLKTIDAFQEVVARDKKNKVFVQELIDEDDNDEEITSDLAYETDEEDGEIYDSDNIKNVEFEDENEITKILQEALSQQINEANFKKKSNQENNKFIEIESNEQKKDNANDGQNQNTQKSMSRSNQQSNDFTKNVSSLKNKKSEQKDSAKIDENEAKEEHENNKKVRLEKIQNIQNK